MHKTLAQFILNSIFGCWWENRVKHNLSNEPQKMEHVVSEFFLFYVSEPNDKAHKFITRWTSWWLGITKQSLTCSFKNLCGRMLHSICLLSNHNSNNNMCFFSRMSHLHLEFNLFIGLIRLNFILQFSAQLHIHESFSLGFCLLCNISFAWVLDWIMFVDTEHLRVLNFSKEKERKRHEMVHDLSFATIQKSKGAFQTRFSRENREIMVII